MNNNRILVLGSNGMLGKMVSIYLSSNKDFDVTITARNTSQFIEDNFSHNYLKFDPNNVKDKRPQKIFRFLHSSSWYETIQKTRLSRNEIYIVFFRNAWRC